MNSRAVTPKPRFAVSSPKKVSTPRSLHKPSTPKVASSLLKAYPAAASSTESMASHEARTPSRMYGTTAFASSKSASSTALNSCYTPSSLYRGTGTAHTVSKSAAKDLGTPKHALKRVKAQEDLLTSRTPDCFSRVESPLSSGRARSVHSMLDESNRSGKKKDKESLPGEISNLKVAVRVRPLSAKECIKSVSSVVRVADNEVTVNAGSTADSLGGVEHCFQYDHAFWSCNAEDPAFVDQNGVFQELMMPLMDKAFEGYNACLFAYGQTGSGKSYSMMGMDLDDLCTEEPNVEAGIIPRFCHELFGRVNAMKDKLHAEVEISYFEIYNEKIHDLLAVSPADGIFAVTSNTGAKKQALKVREHPVWGPYVVGLSTHPVDSYQVLQNWLVVGNSQRATAATGMNDKSSRSHSIFSVTLNLANVDSDSDDGAKSAQQTKRSKISLVDLAGSERVNHSSASGARLKEGVSINQSLLTLGKVISALADPKRTTTSYIPYRDSVLTWLLRENLGGNSRTVMLATISPASTHLDETLATLRYACQARTIVNRVKVNEDPHDRIIRELRAEVERLQVLKQDYERQHRYSSNQNLQPRKIIIEKSIDDGEVEALRQQLAEREQELARAQKSWRERLQEAEDVRRTEMKLLKRKGLALELSAEQRQPCLVNLAADPMLSGTLLYIIPPGTVRIGRPSSFSSPDIILEGPLVSHHHCSIENQKGKLFLIPEDSVHYETFVNGALITERRQLFHGDRLVIGSSHYFRVSNPLCPNRTKKVMVDFHLAQQEILREQENQLRRELDAEKRAAISRLEAERYAHEQEYEERIAALELEKFKYKCDKELLESEKEALKRCDEICGSGEISVDCTPGGTDLAEEIRKIMGRTSDESLAQIQIMVKEASQRCKDIGLDYEFRQAQVLDEGGIFRAVINIVDRENERVAEWLPARLEYWLSVVREKDEIDADNMFENFDLTWKEDIDNNLSALNDSHNSSRIGLNLGSVKDIILGRNSLSNISFCSNITGRRSDGLIRSIFREPNQATDIRKDLFASKEQSDVEENDENVPANNQTSAQKTPRFEQKASVYLKNLQVATLKLKKLCEKQQRNRTSKDEGDLADSIMSVDNNGTAEENMARDFLRSIRDIESSVQHMHFILTEQLVKEDAGKETGRMTKSVRFALEW